MSLDAFDRGFAEYERTQYKGEDPDQCHHPLGDLIFAEDNSEVACSRCGLRWRRHYG